MFVGESSTQQKSTSSTPMPSSMLPASPTSDHDTDILSLSPTPTPRSSRLFSPTPSQCSRFDSDDTMSVGSSMLTAKLRFQIPEFWPPAIMACINQPSLEEQKRVLNSSIRNDITRSLGTHMFSYNPRCSALTLLNSW